MKIVMIFFPNWTEALGWTLINSLWQGLAIMIMLIITLRLIPSRLSQVRYVMACSALALLVILNASTFIYILHKSSHAPASTVVSVENPAGILSATESDLSMESDLTNILDMIDRNIPFILLVWIIGALIFALRMLSGWWYVVKLETEASIVSKEWSGRLENLAKLLQIKRVVRLAQSGRINAPVVIGFIKPIILVPVGMFSGLSTEQIETIFIHELAHIKRCDYLINLIQSFIEAFFFFNPFTWVISTIIRREREYCCDDTVIQKHGSAIAYAHALTLLEEIRLSKSVFALSLAENKNQLLDRIKRLMEKSVKNYSGRERLVPALLLVIGLICASWLTIRTERQTTTEKLSSKEISDTVIKKNEKSARFSRKTITRYDENGEPHQEVIEEFKGDEELRDVMSIQGVWRIPPVHPTDPIPPIDLVIPIPPNVFGPDPLTNFNFMLDTIPGKGFRWRSESQWKDFSEEFEKNFKERFGDFYRTHEKDFEKMMREMEEKFHNRFNEDHFDLLRDFDLSRAVHEKEVLAQIEELKKMSVEEIGEAEEQAKHAMEEALQHMEWQNEHQHQLKQMEQEMQEHSEQFKLMEDKMRDMEVRMKSFEKELKEELVKDGYIGSRDKIKNIQWDDDGQIEVNGKKIKEADKEKYQKLHRKYFKEGGNFRHVE